MEGSLKFLMEQQSKNAKAAIELVYTFLLLCHSLSLNIPFIFFFSFIQLAKKRLNQNPYRKPNPPNRLRKALIGLNCTSPIKLKKANGSIQQPQIIQICISQHRSCDPTIF